MFTTWVLPAAFVLIAAGVFVFAIVRRPSRSAQTGSGRTWYLYIPLVVFAGDALVGVHRPWWERAWKGAVVVLLGGGMLIDWWRTRRIAAKAVDRP